MSPKGWTKGVDSHYYPPLLTSATDVPTSHLVSGTAMHRMDTPPPPVAPQDVALAAAGAAEAKAVAKLAKALQAHSKVPKAVTPKRKRPCCRCTPACARSWLPLAAFTFLVLT